MQLHNTLSGRKEDFAPLNPERVTMYVCGPTVYSFAHIGNARPAVVFDVLARVLRRRYPRVDYTRNITDIDDKINAAAAKEGVAIKVITERYTDIYHEDLDALGVARPTYEPKVTEHLAHIISMVERLIANGSAYAAEGHVLFNVTSYAGYGELSKRDRREMIAGARVEVAPYKKDPGDFVLWKPSTPDQPGWESPWGRGRPGWHIECSAMAEALLGDTIDIHGGGHDLVFPHHENERAQSTAAHDGKTFARYWLHNGFLTMDSEKMSKSVGNVLLIREILKAAPGEAVRLALLTGHYRQPLDWNDEALADARRKLDRLYGALRDAGDVAASDAKAPDAFIAALEDDINTPAALAELFELARALNKASDAAEKATLVAQIKDAGALLGLLQQNPGEWFSQSSGTASEGPSETEIEAALAARIAAKTAKDYKEADRIRDDLKARGVLVEDSKDGQRWRRL
ncbi:cysteine--tRNA ligase [uncultured Nevskia sp.]|uniref:cysteine--tRNA ligase n=1 Tax=uncultured Nevskia sp. TaxID=228950 RepID=UPI0025E2A846|nr:cysteine--tRNA ligase [uncultured Nevskia sp.]